MDASAIVDGGWYWVEYFYPELVAGVVGATLALTALWMLVALRVADRVR